MVVLRAIGRFFARIGRWIKETAWIQPLLIVGAIFAVIFSIPHIIDFFKGVASESDSANKFFAKYQISSSNLESLTTLFDTYSFPVLLIKYGIDLDHYEWSSGFPLLSLISV